MARYAFKAGEEWAMKLSRLSANQREVAGKAIYAGAKVVADKIKSNIESLPEESFRYLHNGDKFSGVPKEQKKDLKESFGVARIDVDANGDYNTKLGFDGYGSQPSKKYPQGLPNQLLARAIESGSSVREKHPFVRPAVTATKKTAQAEMARVVDEEIKKNMK